MIDIEKLTPLDPGNWVCKKFADDGEKISVEMTHADWDMCCKARRALEIMVRRGWSACLNPVDGKTWRVDMNDGTYFAFGREEEYDAGINPADWPDPFTALVEADVWMKKQEEKK